MSEAPLHPCQECGACCAYFRVSFYWRETEEGAFPVPRASTEEYSDFRLCMKGTNLKHRSRCVELEGKVGERVGCQIYLSRPTPCREFAAAFENGLGNPRCDEARARYGLRPLRPEDWLASHDLTRETLPAAAARTQPAGRGGHETAESGGEL